MTKKDLVSEINQLFDGTYDVSSARVVPQTGDLKFAKEGKEMDLAMLFVDIEESTRIVDFSKRITAAKMYKSFLWGITKIVKNEGGEVRSFNGDGVLAVFAGDNRSNNAVRAAMKMVWFLDNILKPKMEGYFSNNQQLAGLPFSFRIGIDEGSILIVKGGYRGDNNNDLVWIGNATNYAVKYSKMADSDFRIRISGNVYKQLETRLKTSNRLLVPEPIWKVASLGLLNGTDNVWKTRWHIEIL